MAHIISQAGQTLDDIAYQVYGDRPEMLAPLANANPHAVGFGVHLPSGIAITIPPVSDTPKILQTINLWD